MSALALRKPTIQTKLAVNTPGDIYEQEADAMASAVMSNKAPLPQPDENRERVSSIQRMVEDEAAIQRMPEDEEMCFACQQDVLQRSPEEGSIQRKGDGKPKVSAATAATVSNPGPGSPLPGAIRHRIEPHVGANLSGVRVHQDRRSHAAAASLQARAFTHGQHIFLNRSESSHNLGLMAHESTHVVQQANAPQLQAKPLIQTQLSQSTVSAQPVSESRSTQSTSDTESTVDRSLPLPASEPISDEINRPRQPAAQDAAAPPVGTEPEADQSAPEEEAAPVSAETAEVNQSASGGETEEGTPASTGIELMTPEPPGSLSTSERKRLNQAKERVGATAEAESTLPPAETNVVSARSTVDEPKEEADAKAEGQIVSQLSAQDEPVPTIESICKRIEQIINAEKPDDEEELAEFDAGEAADSGQAELNQKVEGDAQNIQGDYAQLDEPQEGIPTPATGEIEVPPETVASPEIDATAATPAPVDLNLDEDVAASSQRMTDVGMDREVTRLSAEGAPESPHAKALATQTELEESAQQDVPVVLAAQEQILGSARAGMAAKEQSGEAALNQERTGTIGGVLAQQTTMVTAEEQQRLEISTKAKEIVATTRQKVDDLLNPLPQEALKRWEDGKAKVVKKFEEDLVDVTAWVEENKDSLIGGIITYFSGLPDWIERDFRIAKNNFVTGICQLLKDISTYVDSVIAECESIIDDADRQHKELFENLPKDLEKWAETERQKFSEQLDGLRNKVAETKDSITRDLQKQAVEAAESARDHIKELRSQARGWLGRIVDAIAEFVGDIARYIIDGLLNLVGIEPAAFWAVVDKIGQAIDAIADDPLGFAGNLLEAVGQGFQLFFDRFSDHMLNGLLDWLFSGLGSVGVEIPKDFSLKSVITFFLQLMGISWERIRRLLAKHIGEENVALIEKAYELIANLIEMGPEGIFEMIKEQLDPQAILDQVLQAAVDYLVEALIKVVSARVVLLFNPVGAIVQAVEAIYRVLTWIFENAARIFSLIETIVNGISKIIAGDISGMAKAIEEALARLIAPVVDFLAGYAGLGDLPDKIADTIKGFQDWIEGILDKVIGWLAERAKALLRSLGLGGEEENLPEEALDESDVKNRARIRLMSVLGGEADFEEANDAVNQVETELSSEGLRRLALSPISAQEDEGYYIDAEASPLEHILALRPRITKRNPTVTMAARIITASEDSFNLRTEQRNVLPEGAIASSSFNPLKTFVSRDQPMLSGEVSERTFSSRDRLGRSGTFSSVDIERSGGMRTTGGALIVPPAGSNQVELMTWNTSREYSRDTNHSHAEYQFDGWLRNQDTSFLSDITKIELHLRSFSPCDSDCALLDAMANFASGRSEHNIEFEIKWGAVYDEGDMQHQRTTSEGISILQRKWVLDPSNPLPAGAEHQTSSDQHEVEPVIS